MTGDVRLIRNTAEPMRHPWPADCIVQGGGAGVVFSAGSAYRTAFVEAFPADPPTFLRGEGETIADAEDSCWARFERYAACEHGEYERRGYRNGCGFCTRCGTFFSGVFEKLPEELREPGARRPLLERLFCERDPDALVEVLSTMARVDELPTAPEPSP